MTRPVLTLRRRAQERAAAVRNCALVAEVSSRIAHVAQRASQLEPEDLAELAEACVELVRLNSAFVPGSDVDFGGERFSDEVLALRDRVMCLPSSPAGVAGGRT